MDAKKDEIFLQIQETVANIIKKDKEAIKPECKYIDDLTVDSVAMVQIISALEEVFAYEIDERDAAKMRTVEDTVDYIYENLYQPQNNQ